MYYSLKDVPSPSSIFSVYASFTASFMLVRSMANDIIPHPIRGYLFSTLHHLFNARSTKLTLVIDEHNGMGRNVLYDASDTYLCTKISPDAERLKVSKSPKEKTLTIQFEKGEVIHDSYQGIDLKWNFICEKNNSSDEDHLNMEKQLFELSFDKKYKDKVLHSYLPHVIKKSNEVNDLNKVVKLCTLRHCHPPCWDSINLEHPATFETLAMDQDLKTSIVNDLNLFVKRKDFYKKVGKAWKRGYLLYGPPGTGKSSLIAAIANYLKFDVYDLQLGNITCDSDLRRLLLMTANKSILVIEDIDCGIDVPDLLGDKMAALNDRRNGSAAWMKANDVQLTLSGLLNFIDGLWSSCGDERIIIFTTNHKERLDPALLRPGRMDVHIHMSYCTPQGFKILASNYLNISSSSSSSWHGNYFEEIESLLESASVTPAQVAEELMKSENPMVSLHGLVKLLKRKVTTEKEAQLLENDDHKDGVLQVKRRKFDCAKKRAISNIRKGNRKKSP